MGQVGSSTDANLTYLRNQLSSLFIRLVKLYIHGNKILFYILKTRIIQNNLNNVSLLTHFYKYNKRNAVN